MDRRRALGVALVLVSACAFGSGPLFAKPVYALGVDWHTLSAWRFLSGAVLAWAWLLAWPQRRRHLRTLAPRAVVVALALGLLYTGNSGTYYAGLETVPASLAALIVYVYPAVVAVLAMRLGRRLRGRRAWAALGMALAGVGLSVGGIPEGTTPPALGLALIIASPVIYAFWIVLSARLSGERKGSDVSTGAESAAATALMMTATAGAYWISALAVGRPVLPDQIPLAAWPGLLGVGAVATFVAIQTFYAGTQRIGAAQAALVSTVEPIWTVALASLLFAEVLAPVQLLGGGLIIGGVLLAQTGPITRRRFQPLVRLADE
ncbi:MAG TPA: DMT family transporter [Vitreimonas sp.]|nr:DMT family transporter [Vitreimonas sp.]